MKRLSTILMGIMLAAIVLPGAGCGSKEEGATNHADAATELQQAFLEASPQVQKTVATVIAELESAQSGELEARRESYLNVVRALEAVLAQGQVSSNQAFAVSAVWTRVQYQIRDTPELQNEQLYEAQAALGFRLMQVMQ